MLVGGASLAAVTATAAAAAITSTTTSTTTTAPLASTLFPRFPGNGSLDDVPLGDQPGPPFKEGWPVRPAHWDWSTKRTFYIKNRPGKVLEMSPNGAVQAVSEYNWSCVFVVLSHLSNLVMKGYVSDMYLCMNPNTTHLYARRQVHEDCYINEAERNGTGQRVYNFVRCRTAEGKKCYLGIFRNGTARRGNQARQSQETAQWLPVPVPDEAVKNASDMKETILKAGGWTPPPPVSTPRPVDRREQRRKRVRRWCRNLSVMVPRKEKFLRRCKHDCSILRRMVHDPQRYTRRCLQSYVRRRMRNKALKAAMKAGGETKGGRVEIDDRKVRARVQLLWPEQEDFFRRQRQLWRCNRWRRRKERAGGGRQRPSCSRRQLRRYNRKRAQVRSKSKSRGHRVRHERKKSGQRDGHKGQPAREVMAAGQSDSVTLAALTAR